MCATDFLLHGCKQRKLDKQLLQTAVRANLQQQIVATLGQLPGGKLAVENPGGTLIFEISGDDQIRSILMTGPAEVLKEYDI